MSKILVVDDEERIRGILAAFLKKTGFEVFTAAGGEEAIAFMKSGLAVDLMILDVKMPRVTGLDVLRAKNALQNITPIIFLTGSMSQEGIYAELAKMGFATEDVVYKPVDLFVILDKVKKKLGTNSTSIIGDGI